MESSCNNCNLRYNMNRIKDRLEHIIVEKNQSLLDSQVIYLSQLLDNFIYKCTFCSKDINCLSKLNSKDILNSNVNSTFKYLKNNHFIISLYFYMSQAIKNNQFIYLSMDENLYNDLLNILKITSFPTEYIKFKSIKEVIVSNKNGGLAELEEKIKYISSEDNIKKYNGFRWISQPTYAIKNTSFNDFWNWEMNLSEALRNTNVNSYLSFVHKKYKYINEDKYINEPVIDKSSYANSHDLDDLLFKGLEYKF